MQDPTEVRARVVLMVVLMVWVVVVVVVMKSGHPSDLHGNEAIPASSHFTSLVRCSSERIPGTTLTESRSLCAG